MVCWGVYELRMTLGSLSAMGWAVFLSCSLFGMGLPALELAGRWVELGLSVETEISGRALTDDITWGREVSGGPVSWTQLSHLGGSSPTPGQRPRHCQPHGSEEKEGKKEKRKNKKRTDRTPNQIVIAILNRQNHTKKHTHTHS